MVLNKQSGIASDAMEEEVAAKELSKLQEAITKKDAKTIEQIQPHIGLTFLSAGLANAMSAASTNWADVTKVRQQLEMQRKRRSFLAVGSSMIREEGLKSMANGVTASCLREMTYSTIRMGAYENFKELYSSIVEPTSFANKLLAGATSGALGAAISTPTDLVKVRMQAPRKAPDFKPPYRNSFAAFYEIYKQGSGSEKGFKGGMNNLYRGTTPNIIRACILTSTQIGSYDEIKGFFKRNLQMQEGIGLHFSSSMVAGLFCSLASQPVDVIKVRVMQDRSSNALSLVTSLLKNEGPMALYKGFGMCWARLGTHTVISLVLFERLRSLFGIKPL